MTPHPVWSVNLGRMEYAEAFALQKRLLEAVASGELPDLLLTVEHPSVYTLGANFHEENLPLPRDHYSRLGVDVQPTDRGGDITYHGPNQIVMYPIFNLNRYGKDLHKWLRDLEEATIVALASFGLSARRFPPNTGVWIDDRKICAIGIKVRRWTSMHGIALNCDNDLSPFSWIVPCGIIEYGVTSLTKELGVPTTISSARPALEQAFDTVFNISRIETSKEGLIEALNRLESHGRADATA